MTIDKIYDRLVAAQRPVTRYLWTPADAVTFTPAIVKKALGDGRALFSVWTTNDRPQYWLVRGDSQWSCGDYAAPDDATYIGEMWNEILDAIVEEFGRSRCGYSGSDLRLGIDERHCQCEDCVGDDEAGPILPAHVEYPCIDDHDGGGWSRERWPDGFATAPHPFVSRFPILADGAEAA